MESAFLLWPKFDSFKAWLDTFLRSFWTHSCSEGHCTPRVRACFCPSFGLLWATLSSVWEGNDSGFPWSHGSRALSLLPLGFVLSSCLPEISWFRNRHDFSFPDEPPVSVCTHRSRFWGVPCPGTLVVLGYWKSWDLVDDHLPPSTFFCSPDSFVHHHFSCYLKISLCFKIMLLSSPLPCPEKLLDVSWRPWVLFTLCSAVSTPDLL